MSRRAENPFPFPGDRVPIVPARRRYESRVLLLSLRAYRRQLANSCLFEFEDVVAAVDAVDLVPLPTYQHDPRLVVARKAQQAVRLASGNRLGRRPPLPYPAPIRLEHDYDLIFLVLDSVWDLNLLQLVRGWRSRARCVACFVAEVWDEPFDDWRFRAENFEDFDHLFLATYHDVDRLAEHTGVPCSFLAPGVDTLRFLPRRVAGQRPVHVAYLGRRSPATHRALCKAAAAEDWLYVYDLPGDVAVTDPAGHRRWLADLLTNTKFFVTNYARANEPELARGRRELGYRFFEGAAAGTIMVGEPPDTPPYAEQFPWPTPVVPMPFDAPDVVERLRDLSRDPEQLLEARRRNVAGSLRHHDWLYRWEQVLRTLGLPPSPGMERRRQRLADAAAAWQ